GLGASMMRPNLPIERHALIWNVLLRLIPIIAKRTAILRFHCYMAGLFGEKHRYPIAQTRWCTRDEPWKSTPMMQALAEFWAPFSSMSATGMKQNRTSMLRFASIPTWQMRFYTWVSFSFS